MPSRRGGFRRPNHAGRKCRSSRPRMKPVVGVANRHLTPTGVEYLPAPGPQASPMANEIAPLQGTSWTLTGPCGFLPARFLNHCFSRCSPYRLDPGFSPWYRKHSRGQLSLASGMRKAHRHQTTDCTYPVDFYSTTTLGSSIIFPVMARNQPSGREKVR